MKNAVELAREYPITFAPVSEEEGGGFYAYSEAFPGLMGDGSTRDEAADDLLPVLADAIERRIQNMIPLPQLTENEYSGRLNLRLSKGLHGMLARRAQKECISINSLIIELLSYGLGIKDAIGRVQPAVHIYIAPTANMPALIERSRPATGWRAQRYETIPDGSIKICGGRGGLN